MLPDRGAWIKPPGFAHEQGVQAIIRDCVLFLSSVHGQCGLREGSRKAFITAAHYLHRIACRVDLQQSSLDVCRRVCVVLLFIAGKTEELRWPMGVHGCLQNRGFRAHNMLSVLESSSSSQETTPAAAAAFDLEAFLALERELLDLLDYELVIRPHGHSRSTTEPDEEDDEVWLLANTAQCLY